MAGVDADYRYVQGSHTPGGAKEGTVATNTYGNVRTQGAGRFLRLNLRKASGMERTGLYSGPADDIEKSEDFLLAFGRGIGDEQGCFHYISFFIPSGMRGKP